MEAWVLALIWFTVGLFIGALGTVVWLTHETDQEENPF